MVVGLDLIPFATLKDVILGALGVSLFCSECTTSTTPVTDDQAVIQK